MELAIMILGFALASYSVVGNDSIQTLGTFLASNEKRPWWVLWLFAGGIMFVVLMVGYFSTPDTKVDPGMLQEVQLTDAEGNSETYYVLKEGVSIEESDVAYNRLDKVVYETIKVPDPKDPSSELKLNTYDPETGEKVRKEIPIDFWYLLPPIVLLVITRFGIPVSTTFLILSFFSLKNLPDMLFKSLAGYAVAFITGLVFYLIASKAVERIFIKRPMGSDSSLWTNLNFWVALQWLSTGFLWSQWLTQDLANIYIYFKYPETLSPGLFIFSVVLLMGMLAYIFYQRGGAIQGIVKSKTNTADIRSATFIDFFYGLILLTFKYDTIVPGKVPMSTTWVFLGLLAGRELGIRMQLGPKPDRRLSLMIFSDVGKAAVGLIVSIVLVLILYYVQGKDPSTLFTF